MKLRTLAILLIILVSLIPVYLLNKYLQPKIRPKQSGGRLFLYIISGFLLVFVYTFLVVLVIRKLFPVA
ncbi:MAG: hypothetical protein ACHQFX_05895 [Chitinophagales bacterium]